MSLRREKSASIRSGWIRALLLLIAYTTLTVAAGFLTGSLQSWIVYSFLISIGLVYLFRIYIERRDFSMAGLGFGEVYPDALIGLLLGVVLTGSGSLIIFLSGGIEWIDRSFDARELFMSAVLLALASLSEELVFRGYVLRNLMKSFPGWASLIISALLFTLVHFNGDTPVIALLSIFLGGMITGITFMLTRSLWLPVLFHFSWNFVQGPLLGFAVTGVSFTSILTMEMKGPDALTGGSFGFEGSLVSAPLLLLSFLAAFYRYNKKLRAR